MISVELMLLYYFVNRVPVALFCFVKRVKQSIILILAGPLTARESTVRFFMDESITGNRLSNWRAMPVAHPACWVRGFCVAVILIHADATKRVPPA